MNNVRVRFSKVMIYSLSILLSPYICASPRSQVQLSKIEREEVLHNEDANYISVDKESSIIYDIILQVIRWDKDQNSLLYQLKDHIEHGYTIGEYNSVAQALDYAAALLEQN